MPCVKIMVPVGSFITVMTCFMTILNTFCSCILASQPDGQTQIEVTGSLVDALRDMEQRFDPEWVLAELTGIAYLDGLRHTMESYLPKTCSIICVAVADASRWASLSRALPKVIERQTEGADLLAINKADLNGDTEKIEAEVRQMGVSCPVFPMSAVTDSGARLLAEVEKAF